MFVQVIEARTQAWSVASLTPRPRTSALRTPPASLMTKRTERSPCRSGAVWSAAL